MKIYNTLEFDMLGGWFIGDFKPVVYRTKKFEVCYKVHLKGEKWPKHKHEKSIEINYLIRGSMIINGEFLLKAPTIFVVEKDEVVYPEFLEDCEIIVVKVPSIPSDKIIIKE